MYRILAIDELRPAYRVKQSSNSNIKNINEHFCRLQSLNEIRKKKQRLVLAVVN